MKNTIYLLLLAITLIACKENKGNLTIQLDAHDLKKGMIYLQQINQEDYITIDSIAVNGDADVVFNRNIETPDIYRVQFEKFPKEPIVFFAEPGVINIKTDLRNFSVNATVSGSKNDALLQKHNDYIQQFSFKNLELVKEKFEALKNSNTEIVTSLENRYLQNLKRQYLFTTNYAIRYKDFEISPYIAVTQMKQANPNLKKQIYDALTDNIKQSKYGVLLKKQIDTK